MKELIIVQHCQSEHHVNDLTGGWTDTPLTPLGRKQAHAIGKHLQENLHVEAYSLFSSDLLRASQTAEIVGETLNLTPTMLPNMRERNWGEATGKNQAWFDTHISPFPDTGRLDHVPIKGAETWRQFYHRISEGLQHIQAKSLEKVIVVTHGGVVTATVAWWLQIPLSVIEKAYFGGKAGSISILKQDPNGLMCLDQLGNRCHLQEVDAGT